MAKLTMKQMLWLGKPLSWKKDWKSISLKVDPHTTYPDNCPSIIAAWDQDITATARLSISSAGTESGIIIFQTPQTMCAFGANSEGFKLHFQVMGWKEESFIPQHIKDDHILLRFTRKESTYAISYSLDGETYLPIAQGALPGMEHSYSFGWYWTNSTDTPFEATVDTFIVSTI